MIRHVLLLFLVTLGLYYFLLQRPSTSTPPMRLAESSNESRATAPPHHQEYTEVADAPTEPATLEELKSKFLEVKKKTGKSDTELCELGYPYACKSLINDKMRELYRASHESSHQEILERASWIIEKAWPLCRAGVSLSCTRITISMRLSPEHFKEQVEQHEKFLNDICGKVEAGCTALAIFKKSVRGSGEQEEREIYRMGCVREDAHSCRMFAILSEHHLRDANWGHMQACRLSKELCCDTLTDIQLVDDKKSIVDGCIRSCKQAQYGCDELAKYFGKFDLRTASRYWKKSCRSSLSYCEEAIYFELQNGEESLAIEHLNFLCRSGDREQIVEILEDSTDELCANNTVDMNLLRARVQPDSD